MNWAHVHLVINHIPVLGTVFAYAIASISVSYAEE